MTPIARRMFLKAVGLSGAALLAPPLPALEARRIFGNFLGGKISDISIWNRVLAPEELDIIYRSCVADVLKMDGLVEYWSLDEAVEGIPCDE